QAVDFSLIRPYHPFPVLQSPILVSIGKIKSCLVMLGREDRSFTLDHSLHTSLL
ncbi:hypothetical protein PISMIDRAFT_636821, partial [Pisolithus microcarpus 441]